MDRWINFVAIEEIQMIKKQSGVKVADIFNNVVRK